MCGKELKQGYLCKEHARELKEALRKKENIVDKPTFAYHCQVCGEFEGRGVIVEHPPGLDFCQKCIEESEC
jgi:hypothetical protein